MLLLANQGRRGIGGAAPTPPPPPPSKIGKFQIFGKLDARLDVYSEIKYMYIPHMNEKMTAFNYTVQCYKCNCLLIKENENKPNRFPKEKTCHYAENMSLFGQSSKAVV